MGNVYFGVVAIGAVLALLPANVARRTAIGGGAALVLFFIFNLGFKDGIGVSIYLLVVYISALFVGWMVGWFIRRRVLKWDRGTEEGEG